MAATIAAMSDRCDNIYKQIEKEVASQRSALVVIEKCAESEKCRDSEVDPAIVQAFDQYKLVNLVKEISDWSNTDKSCRPRYMDKVNKMVEELISETQKVSDKLRK